MNRFSSLDGWFSSLQGKSVGLTFTSVLQRIFGDGLRGDILLQFNHCGYSPWFTCLHFKNKYILNMCTDERHPSCVVLPHALPFDNHSVNCMLTPLTFDLLAHNHNLLDEWDRVLKPMGHIIIFSVNPWSVWGGASRLGLVRDLGHCGIKLISANNIASAMLARGYRVAGLEYFYYLPPLNNPIIMQKLSFMNHFEKVIPYFAGFYCLVLQKYTPGLTPLSLKTTRKAWDEQVPIYCGRQFKHLK